MKQTRLSAGVASSAAAERVVIGDRPLTIEDVIAVGRDRAELGLSGAPEFRQRLQRSSRLLQRELEKGARVYGVNTGFGDSCEVDVVGEPMVDLPLNLVRFHGCGTGKAFDDDAVACILIARLASLARGCSAVRVELLEQLVALVNARLCPVIPERGSVGASGDLTPLSYVAACLLGEREARLQGELMSAARALERLELRPLRLEPKESLALMNGTSVMTGLACLVFERARRLVRFGAALTAMAVEALGAQRAQFDDRIFALKPHPGQRACARWIRQDLSTEAMAMAPARFQDRYSIRCAPHVLGVLADALPPARRIIETELNSVNDNPLVDGETGQVLHCGNFYGGHVCQALDTLKTCIANLADLFDRQLLLLCNPASNGGLPANLSGLPGGHHHGFKAVQIGTAALAAEAAKLTLPASVFSRSTENHNQDKVSMGTIAARDALAILELTETAAAMELLALCQAYDQRGFAASGGRGARLLRQVRAHVAPLERDRAMDREIELVLELYRSRQLDSGEPDFG